MENIIQNVKNINIKDSNHLKSIIKNIPNDYKVIFVDMEENNIEKEVLIYEAWENIGIEPWAWKDIIQSWKELKDFLSIKIDQNYNYWLKWETNITIDNNKKEIIFS